MGERVRSAANTFARSQSAFSVTQRHVRVIQVFRARTRNGRRKENAGVPVHPHPHRPRPSCAARPGSLGAERAQRSFPACAIAQKSVPHDSFKSPGSAFPQSIPCTNKRFPPTLGVMYDRRP